MATNIPPHNLREVINAVVQIIDDQIEDKEETTIEEILKIIKGPDFPTGGMILGTRGIEEAYRTGRGKIRVRAVTDIEAMPNGKSRIIVSELPYMVNKARLIEKIAELVRDKKIDGITDLSDQSSREGMRVVIELRRDANANVILNQLYKHTQLQDTFGVIMLALVGNEPKVMNLMEMLNYYLRHQEEVVTRRTQYELNKAEERAHILQGLLIALDNIDEVIKIIRGSQTVQIAKSELMERFGLTDVQAQAIVDMRLRALTGLEREKLEAEYKALMEQIEHLRAILADRKLLLGVIKEEILVIRDKYGDERRTSIGFDEFDISMEPDPKGRCCHHDDKAWIYQENVSRYIQSPEPWRQGNQRYAEAGRGLCRRTLHDQYTSLPDVLYEHRTCIPHESIRDPGSKQNIQRNCNRESVTVNAGREDQCGHSNREI